MISEKDKLSRNIDKKSCWDPQVEYTQGLMNKRINTATLSRGWRQTIKIIRESFFSLENLKVADFTDLI